jgi:hypothetical protein
MKKENFLLVLLILFTVSGLNAQNLNCEINGSFVDSTRYKYAYLVESKLNIFMKTPIIDQKFKFNLTQPENYQTTQLYFEEDSVKTNAYFLEQAKRLSDNRRIVTIENADLIFGNNALNMKVVMSKLNKDINEMYKAMETRGFQTFFDQHPVSEI